MSEPLPVKAISTGSGNLRAPAQLSRDREDFITSAYSRIRHNVTASSSSNSLGIICTSASSFLSLPSSFSNSPRPSQVGLPDSPSFASRQTMRTDRHSHVSSSPPPLTPPSPPDLMLDQQLHAFPDLSFSGKLSIKRPPVVRVAYAILDLQNDEDDGEDDLFSITMEYSGSRKSSSATTLCSTGKDNLKSLRPLLGTVSPVVDENEVTPKRSLRDKSQKHPLPWSSVARRYSFISSISSPIEDRPRLASTPETGRQIGASTAQSQYKNNGNTFSSPSSLHNRPGERRRQSVRFQLDGQKSQRQADRPISSDLHAMIDQLNALLLSYSDTTVCK
jgi:hypothetical protein